jgi:acetyl-CoA carboxylase carboxyl transferase subunit beta
MALFEEKPKIAAPKAKKREIPSGLWVKCKGCGEMIFHKELEDNLRVCPKCQFHFTMGARARIASLIDSGTFREQNADLVSVDVLKFTGVASYTDRLRAYQKQTGLNDAVVTGTGQLEKRKVAIAAMDFDFLGGSMGSVVGEKVAALIETGTEEKIPVIIVSATGGARMYEGMLSLMQMAKTSAALALHAKAGLLYISVLSHPSTAGVMASYGSLGDIIMAEPRALIGFAGPRVIKETTQQELPEGFQTSEFLLEHGLIDLIVHRKQLKSTLAQIIGYCSRKN